MLARARRSFTTLLPMPGSRESLFEQIFAITPVALSVCDEKGEIRFANEAFSHLSGYALSELVGSNMSLLKSSKNPYPFFEKFWKEIRETGRFEGEIWNQVKNGSNRLHRVSVTKMGGSEEYYLSTHTDITESSAMEERYRYLAQHDPLTGLANRALLEDRLSHALSNAARSGTWVGVIYCDLNEFKILNDQYGHTVGDEILKETAKRLHTFFRTNDTVARIGGDEFVVVIEQLHDDHEFTTMLDTLYAKMHLPYILSETLPVSMSIGSACFPRDGLNAKQLLEIADTNMYRKKNRFYGLLD